MTDPTNPTDPTVPTGAPETLPTPPQAPLIYLDADDEITSAAARIRASGSERIGLVLPYGSRLATSRINFRLLAREATERGKLIEIICADASARALAQSAGLAVHPSVAAFEGREAGSEVGPDLVAGAAGAATVATASEPAGPDDTQTRVLPVPRRSSPKVPIVGPPRPPMRTGLAVGIGIAVLVLVLVGGFLAVDLLPSATIVLHPRSAEIGPLALTIQARTDVSAPDPEALAIPAEVVTFQLQAAQTFPATGTKLVETKATGNVTFSNFDTGGSITIDAGAIVRTPSGVGFATLAKVTLPNAAIQFPFTIVPSTAKVAVQAVLAGPAGNVGNNTITVVPKGENKRLLQVVNLEATTGGASSQTQVVSAADVDAAKLAMTTALAAELGRQLNERTGVQAGITLFPETKVVGAAQYAVDPKTLVDTAAADFQLAASAQGTALGVDPAPLGTIAEARLRAKGAPGWTIDPASIASDVGTPTVVAGVISYPVTVHGTQVRDVDKAALVAQIKGLVLAAAVSRLDEYGDVQIVLSPDWVTTVPTHQDRISFTVAEPRPSATPGL